MGLLCPRCNDDCLEEIELKNVMVDRCKICGGIWFDHDELSEIVGQRAGVKTFESIVPPRQENSIKFNCPRCENVRLRELAVGDRGESGESKKVMRCISCYGTWIDRGELRDEEDKHIRDSLTGYFNKVFTKPESKE